MSSQAEVLTTAARALFQEPFGGVLRIECTEDGSSLWVDGREELVVGDKAPSELSSHYCLWRGDAETLRSVLSGQRRLETAYTSGALKISGDMAVMARLNMGNED